MTNPLQDFRPESLCLLKESQVYWQYARKEPCDFSVYTEESSIYEAPAKERFRESSEVLVRWTDGLLYLAHIIQVEEEYNRCAVKFEDGSQYWALFKDIYKGPPPNGEIACTVCDSGSSHPPDEIVICDLCTVGYHQLCHIPNISSTVLKPEIKWNCRKCIFASATKKGGSLKKGPHAQAMMVMKQALPYDPKSLTWDLSHRSNSQQTYCYCGGPGEWYMKMLQCTRCKQWFHEACLQCLEEPILYGDRFYIFVCSVCNNGPEFLRRLPLKWPDIVHLVLYNLSVMHGKKYFDLDTTIMIFLKDKWSQFYVKGEDMVGMSNDDRKEKMLYILQNTKTRFTSGKEIKKKTTVWGLKSRRPPVPPSASDMKLPELGSINNDVFDSLFLNGKKSKIFRLKSISTPISLRRTRKPSVPDTESSDTKSFPKSEKSIQSSLEERKAKRVQEMPKTMEVRKPRRRRRMTKLNGVRKFSLALPSMCDFSDSCDTSSSQGTLNTIIPPPTNFEGQNNPFLNSYKLNNTVPEQQTTPPRTRKNTEPPPTNQSMTLRTRSHRKPIRHTRSMVNKLLNGSCTKTKTEITKDTSVTVKLQTNSNLNSSVNSYFGAENRIANGEKFSILAKRTAPDGKVQYLLEWEGIPS